MSRTKFLLAAAATLLVSTVSAQVEYDASFWESFDSEEPYEHKWLNVPDLVDKQQVEWWFNVTHHTLTGIERGMYMNDSIVLNEDCFGSKYVTKINEFAAMCEHDFWKNIFQEMAIIYQLYYMWGEKCKID